tara:strand:- start:4167 stop:4400 length:234 start_codon:yes stop_codon:yes gene_type:complete
MDNTYNGWTNRETWLVGLWFNPETKRDIDYLEETLEAEFLTIMETVTGSTANIYVDMIDFHCINWDELREAQEDEEE